MKTINQTKIAKVAGVTQGFISQVFTKKRRPSWKTAKRLAEATKTNPELWLEGTPDQIREAIKNASNQ